jgi:DNA polymerase III subunit delta
MLKPVYALVGPDIFLQLQKQTEIIQEAPADAQRMDIDGERAELVDVLDELRSFAMFGGHKLVIVREADDFISRFREQLEKYLSSPVDSATLILRCDSLNKSTRIYKLIAKLGGIQACEPPRELMSWITGRAKTSHGIMLTAETSRLLADLVGSDLGRLDNELAKLALSVKGTRVTPEDIAGTVAFQKEMEMAELTNALTAGNIQEAVRRWRHLIQLDPGSEYRVFTWLTIWLAGVQKALRMKKAGRGNMDIYQEIRIWKQELKEPFLRTIVKLGQEGTEKALAQLAEVEYQSKTGVGDAAENVERFLLSLPLV